MKQTVADYKALNPINRFMVSAYALTVSYLAVSLIGYGLNLLSGKGF